MDEINRERKLDSDEDYLEVRKEKIIEFFKKSQIWVLAVLIIVLILGIYIRSLPMSDHGGRPGLWDITRNTWTLGPDLDPWLFLRGAKTIVETGSLPERDMMRNVPLGFDNSKESQLLPYLIAWTFQALNFIGINKGIEYAGVIFPVIMFGLTIISYFLFVREIFARKSKKSKLKANIIALIASFFMIVFPAFLSRTIAGIPEKESAAFFFIFLSFYFFLKGWKSDGIYVVIFGILSGISTALMSLIWGGNLYIFIPIALSSLIAFIFNKIHKKEFLVYSTWIIVSFFLMALLPSRYSFIGLITSLSSGNAFIVFFVILVDKILRKSNLKIIKNRKIPSNIISLIVGIVLLAVLVTIFFGPTFIIEKLKAIHQALFKPTIGRWNITVAENKQPYFTEWVSSFGPYVKNIPITFWLFFAGSAVLFRKMLVKLRRKDAWILTGFYILLFFGIVFSRYSPGSLFNGENFISEAFYYLSVLLLIGFFIYFYIKYFKKEDKSFEKIRYEYLLLFSLLILVLFTVRGAVRLVMVLAPIAPIFIGFLIVEYIDKFRKTKEETRRILLGIAIIIILIASFFSFWVFYKDAKAQAYEFVPSSYNFQWQKAMQWVRENTDKNAVFGHWWDYGYWVQSIGERATVLDGGNAIAYWNYLMGRYVLTGDNQEEALEYLYNHNATHLLIDSTDIGKYTAFSSIGSDINYDRYSWIGAFVRDDSQTQETKNQTIYFYGGGVGLDEDLIINESEKNILLPGQNAGVGAILLPRSNSNENSQETVFQQPYIIVVYQGQQHRVNLRYLYIGENLYDFKSGIEAAAFIFPRMEQQGQGLSHDPVGAAMFISPRLFRGLLSQIYILDDPLNRFPNFKLAHTQQSLFVESLESQGLNLPDFVYFNGIQGPIKIWEIKYTGNEQIREKYMDTDYTKYLNWLL